VIPSEGGRLQGCLPIDPGSQRTLLMGCRLGGSVWSSYVTRDAPDIAESRRRLEVDIVYPKWFALSTVPCIAHAEGAVSGVAAHVVLLGGVPQWFVRIVVGVAPVVCPDQTEPERSVVGRRNADRRAALPVTSGWPRLGE
jgi:hypothetical protein